MFSILSRIFPSLKIRLLAMSFLMLSLLTGAGLYTTYQSISNEFDSAKISQLNSRYSNIVLEYEEELNKHHKHNEGRKSSENIAREARKEFLEELRDIEEVFEYTNEWAYLLDPSLKMIISSKSSPDYKFILPGIKGIKVTERPVVGSSVILSKTPFIYSARKFSDGNILLLAADNSAKPAFMANYKKNFLIVFIAVILFGMLLFWLVINSSLKGFGQVRNAADTIAEGNYEFRVETPQNSGSEVLELADSFNVMIERTYNLIKEIKDVSNNVAHDLRTPITRIRGKMETAMMADVDLTEHRETAGVVIEECDKMMLLIDDILTLAQYESGLIRKKDEKIEMNELLLTLCDIFETVADDRGQEILLESGDAEMFISGDREKLQRSLSNLLDNALKYSPDNSEVRVTAENRNGGLYIKFFDSGCGISKEDQTRIFERFYRVETSRTTKGNGLGLNLAKAFIENHGGRIAVKSEVSKGSCFEVHLPISQ